jgi:hypothetical protein
VWCFFWFGFEGGLAALITQQMSAPHLAEHVSARSYRRLGRLNGYLDRLIDIAWNKTPTDDIIPDLPALIQLESEVLKAAAVYRRNLSRGRALDFGRGLATLEVVLAVLFAAIAAATGLRSELNLPASIAFAVGTIPAIVCLLFGVMCSITIEQGEDLL